MRNCMTRSAGRWSFAFRHQRHASRSRTLIASRCSETPPGNRRRCSLPAAAVIEDDQVYRDSMGLRTWRVCQPRRRPSFASNRRRRRELSPLGISPFCRAPELAETTVRGRLAGSNDFKTQGSQREPRSGREVMPCAHACALPAEGDHRKLFPEASVRAAISDRQHQHDAERQQERRPR